MASNFFAAQAEYQARLAGTVKLATDLAASFGTRAEEHERNNTFPFENYEDLQRTGYLTLSIPPEFGGQGASVEEITRAQVQMGQGCASTALVVGMHLAQIGRAVDLGNWPPNVLEKFLRDIAKTGALYNNAATEPATGSPSRGGMPTTRAEQLPNGGWRITGRKTFTTGAPVLHYITVWAAIERGEKTEAATFLLTKDTPGVRVETTWNSLFMRLSGSHDLILENVELPPEAYLGPNAKSSPAQAVCNAGWGLPIAAVYFGIGRAAANYALNFARNHRPNSLNKSIAELPPIQEKVGRLEATLMSAESVLYEMAAALDLQRVGQAVMPAEELQARIGAAKYLATNRALEAVDLAIRVVGAAGLQMTEPLQRYYRDVRAGLHNPPMDDVSMTLLGKTLLKV